MKKLLELISEEMGAAFEKAGYDKDLGKVNISNRPDLCEYQCNGAMAGAKRFGKAPIMIANDVAAALKGSRTFSEVNAVAPGFLNLKIADEFLLNYVKEMAADKYFGLNRTGEGESIVVDYGGPNVAKPLHVGHLRSAVIGESVKRIQRYMGYKVIGDIHSGDWGLQMGLVINEIKNRMPDLPYFDDSFTGEYPEGAPVTVHDLEEIYPTASAKSKEDEAYKAKAMEATKKLQDGVRGYRALWERLIAISNADMKKIYDSLNVHFDLWNGESSVHDRIPAMVKYLKDGGYAYISDGALVVDVKKDTDTKEMPPCMILKSDGASLYNTTDLATIQQRVEDFKPSRIIYLTDKRQELYFEQVFRCAKKTKLCPEDTDLFHIGFGTVNGKDGKPYKTRSGGVPKLQDLIEEITEEMLRKIKENNESKGYNATEEEAKKTADIVGIAAIKYGDLSNQPAKDYVFDVDRFTSFEGDTGPYILYTIVRIKSILARYAENGGKASKDNLNGVYGEAEKDLMKALTAFHGTLEAAAAECAPNKICAFIYDLANAFNHFYHETQILSETDETKKAGLIAMLVLVKEVLETCIDLLGFEAPERM